MTAEVTIVEVAPRDGLQGLAGFVPTEAKVARVAALAEAGFAELAAIVASLPEDGPSLRWNISCALRCPFEGVVPAARILALVERVAALRPGLDIALADTTGNASPEQARALFCEAIGRFGDRARFAFHGHDTYTLGIANVAAARGDDAVLA